MFFKRNKKSEAESNSIMDLLADIDTEFLKEEIESRGWITKRRSKNSRIHLAWNIGDGEFGSRCGLRASTKFNNLTKIKKDVTCHRCISFSDGKYYGMPFQKDDPRRHQRVTHKDNVDS